MLTNDTIGTVAFGHQSHKIRAADILRHPVTPHLRQSIVVILSLPTATSGFHRASIVSASLQTIPQSTARYVLRRVVWYTAMVSASLIVGFTIGAMAQSINAREWQGTNAVTRQPEQVVAGTMAEWRSLWSRVGMHAPDIFEPGRMSAVGIFLGARQGEGYSINLLSTTRRRDRIMVVFEERAPAEVMLAQRMPAAPPARTVSSVPAIGSSFAAPGGTSSLAPIPTRPVGPVTSPWAIVLINRADLPVTVEQRWFR